MIEDLSIDRFREIAVQIEAEIGKIIIGQRQVVRLVLISILAGGHVLLEGVPGLGKTMLIRTLGQVLDLTFARIQFTPDLMPADITGTEILVGSEGAREFQFQPGPIFANLVLADEINRATPKTQSALLEAMQEASVTVAEQTYSLPPPFFVMATQNPLEMEGTYPLPEAQLDRFLLKINVPYPPVEDLSRIIALTTGVEPPKANKVVGGSTLMTMRKLAREVPVPSHVMDYAAQLVARTHPTHPQAPELIQNFVRYGASPRGGQALILAGKVAALLDGRYNVAGEDIRSLAAPSLRHRLILNFEALAEEISPETVIDDLISLNPL